MIFLTYDDIATRDVQEKIEKLQNISEIDLNTQIKLWRETLHFRRQTIRDKTTSDILKEFPYYSNPVFVSLISSKYVFLPNKIIFKGIRRSKNGYASRFTCYCSTTNSYST